jgi:hypothetical protein
MTALQRRTVRSVLLAAALAWTTVLGGSGRALALEVGQPAPDFKLPGTMGSDVSLTDFRSKKWVLLEFYGADFSPT